MVRSNRRKFGGVLIPQNIGGDPKDIQEMTNMLKDKQIKAGRLILEFQEELGELQSLELNLQMTCTSYGKIGITQVRSLEGEKHAAI